MPTRRITALIRKVGGVQLAGKIQSKWNSFDSMILIEIARSGKLHGSPEMKTRYVALLLNLNYPPPISSSQSVNQTMESVLERDRYTSCRISLS